MSIALGEYVSVSSQSDSQRAVIEKERKELIDDPDGELDELAGLYEERGLFPSHGQAGSGRTHPTRCAEGLTCPSS